MTTLRKVLAITAIALLGLIIAAGVWVASLFLLPSEVAGLRDDLVAGRAAHTQVQLSLGVVSTTLVRMVASHIPEARADVRAGLAAVHSVAVGVYQVKALDVSDLRLAAADAAMARRGWTRMLCVRQRGQLVVAYTPATRGSARVVPVCLAVCKDDRVVVVSARLNTAGLAELAADHLPENIRRL